MQTQITFSGTPHSSIVEAAIEKKIENLHKLNAHMLACHIVVSSAHHSHHASNVYHVLIEISVPGKDIIVSREDHSERAHEDVYVAIRDAFAAARRQLEDYTHIRRGDVKTHRRSVNEE